VLRRLLTNPGDYVWQPAYGAGLGQFVGQDNIAAAAAGLIYSQIFEESSIARQPVPKVSADTQGNGSVVVNIQYADASSGQSQTLAFSMSL
jgi:phage baseplate assembly protein W